MGIVYPKFQEDDRCVVIVGDDKDDGSEPLLVFSDGTYINDVLVQHQEVKKKRGRPCKRAATRSSPIVIDGDETTVKTPSRSKERARSNLSTSKRKLRSSQQAASTPSASSKLLVSVKTIPATKGEQDGHLIIYLICSTRPSATIP